MSNGRNTSGIAPESVHSTIGKYMLADGFEIVLDLGQSEGSYIVDSRTGRRFLDFFTCFASSPVGFNHPKMTTPEFVQKLGRAAINKPSNSDLYTAEMAEFVDTFGRLAATPELHKLFFISGGALAVENALKAAFDWKIRLNIERGVNRPDTPDRDLKGTKVIHFEQAFHGRTGYTLSLTNTFDPRKTQYFPKFDWPRVGTPKAAFPLEGTNLDETVKREQRVLAQITEALGANADDVAAILIEPIQAEGGDNHFRPEFLQALRKIADENDVLLIFDEVQTGMGMTGTMWAYQQMGMAPDILSFGKKSQICGIMASDRLDEVKDNVFQVSSRINSTWGGNLVDMVRCQRYLEIIDEEKLVDNARDMGARFLTGLGTVAGAAAGRITNVRGRGLMCAFDLPTTEMRGSFLSRLSGNGMMALPCGRSTVRFRPALSVSAAEIDEALSLLEKTAREI